MNFDDEAWLSVTDTFYSAAIEGQGWDCALEGLALATGSRVGELIGLASGNPALFHYITDLGPDWAEEFIAYGGHDPRVNPLVRAGTQIPAMTVLSTGDFLTPEERKGNPFMADFARRHDTQYACLVPLIRDSSMLVGLSVIRSGRQGEIEAGQRTIFSTIAPHVRAAVRMQMALEHKGALIMAGALESLSLAVFVCDRLGTVKAMTPAAEALVGKGRKLRLRRGILGSADRTETRLIAAAIGTASVGLSSPAAPLSGTVLIRHGLATPLVLDVLPVPLKDSTFGFEPRALVVVRGAKPEPGRQARLLQLIYRLTAAETAVALTLVEGASPDTIAAARGTSIGTVRAQIRSIYSKLNVHRLSELISALKRLE